MPTIMTAASPGSVPEVHDQNDTVPGSIYNLPHNQLCPGNGHAEARAGKPRYLRRDFILTPIASLYSASPVNPSEIRTQRTTRDA